jgi:DNA-binding transcriptional MerR regulator
MVESRSRQVFRIGDFSRLSRVSIKMLRHYDALGLLKPVWVDPFTDYRYYSADQLPRLNRLIALKELGFTLEQVRLLLDESLSDEQLRGMLRRRQAEIEQSLETGRTRLAVLEMRLRQVEQEGTMPPYEVILRPGESQLVATSRTVLPAIAGVEALFQAVERHVARYGGRAASMPRLLYHDGDYREEEVDVEVVVPLSHVIPGTESIRVYTLAPTPTMACVVHTGSYATLDDAYGALLTWIERQGYEIAGPIHEVYLRFGKGDLQVALPDLYLAQSTADFVTELQIPVSRKTEPAV